MVRTCEGCIQLGGCRVSGTSFPQAGEGFKRKPVCWSFSVEAPYIVHALPSQTVFNFLSQRHDKLCHFIPDIMDLS